MLNLDDSLTEIDWLNSLRIKKSNESNDTNDVNVLVNKFPTKTTEKSQNLQIPDGYDTKELTKLLHIPIICETSELSQNLHVPYDCERSEQSKNVPRSHTYEKPSYSYAYLIKLAIESSRNKRMKLNEIYAWIMEKYPYYKQRQTENCKGWKNAIRHNLSLNKVFKRCAKESSESGKGSYWTIDSECGVSYIQIPPVKKMKTYYLISTHIKKQDNIMSDNLLKNKSNDMSQMSDTVKIIESPGNPESIQLSYNSDSNTNANNSSSEPMNDSSNDKFNSSQSAFSTYPCKSLGDSKTNLFTSSFSNRSAFIPYSIYNNSINRSSELSNSTCEISYTPNMTNSNESRKHLNNNRASFLTNHHDKSSSFDLSETLKTKLTNDNLEIDEGETGTGNEDIILKTPALCQINTTAEFRESSDENVTTKYPKMTGCNHETTETIFDTNNLYDSFFSIHQSLLESDYDLRQMPFDKPPSHDISFSQNISYSTRSQFGTVISDNQNLFEGSLGLSANTKNILFNASGLKENYLSGSQWLELNENYYRNEREENINLADESEAYETTNGFDNHNPTHDGITPSQDFLEMKNHLRCYRFRQNSLAESNKPSSVSTSSTVKSTDTAHSKSPACDKKADVVANNAINSNDVLTVMNQVSKSQLSEDEDDIEDCCNWDTFV